ncbi:MAG: hypothetical protein ACO2O6_01280 [Candidatus Hydrothermia bacterium]|jgi:hypothetical protein
MFNAILNFLNELLNIIKFIVENKRVDLMILLIVFTIALTIGIIISIVLIIALILVIKQFLIKFSLASINFISNILINLFRGGVK